MSSTVTYTCSKDASARDGSVGWSGWDDHHPCGMGSAKYKSFVYFPINFSGMTSIVSATLKLTGHRAGSGNHVYGNASQSGRILLVRRMTSDWGEGTDRGESIWSSNESWNYTNRATAYTTSGQTSHACTTYGEGVVMSINVLDIVNAWYSGSNNYGFCLNNNDMTTVGDGLEFYARHVSGKKPELTIVYETNTAPTAPSLSTPTIGAVTTTSPTFTATMNDADANDKVGSAQVIVYNDAGGTSLKWDSGQVAQSRTATSFSIAYAGTTLSGNTTYYWKARNSDLAGSWSPYTGLRAFKPNNSPPTPTNVTPTANSTITTLTPTFTGASDDPDPNDQLAYARVVVYNDAGGTSVKWDSGDVSSSGSSFSITCGTTLAPNGVSYWVRAQTADTNGWYSGWSALQKFTTYTAGLPTGLVVKNSSGGSAVSKTTTLTPYIAFTTPTTMNLYDMIIYNGTTGATHVSLTNVASSGTTVNYLYATTALSWGSKYRVKVRYRDTNNIWSAYSPDETGMTFYTNSAPVATQTSPVNNAVVTTLTPQYTSTFSDADKALGFADAPSSYVVEVSMMYSPYTVMHTLTKSAGLTTTSNSTARAAEGTALSLDTWYRWRCYYVDNTGSANATGSYTGYAGFKPSAIPTTSGLAVIANDLTLGYINKGNPTLTWTFSGSGGKSQAKRKMVVKDVNDLSVYDSGWQTSSSTSFAMPSGKLSNGQDYTFYLYAEDTDTLQADYDSVTYTTTWTPPAVIEGVSATAYDDAGYVKIEWDPSADGNYVKYTLYRRSYGAEDWETYAVITNVNQPFYDDYNTGYGVEYEYMVKQSSLVGADTVESYPSEVTTGALSSDDWWIVAPNRPDLTFSIAVTDESHSAPFQEEVFEPFGRNRKVIVRSGILGNEGTVEIYFDLFERKAKEAQLTAILNLTDAVYIKSPFGDYYYSYFGAPTKSYLNGGAMKISLPYTEVY